MSNQAMLKTGTVITRMYRMCLRISLSTRAMLRSSLVLAMSNLRKVICKDNTNRVAIPLTNLVKIQ